MKGMIFAAGLGSRLRPLTDTCPKALIEVGGETQLDRVIRRMRQAGIDDITINVYHHAEMVKRHIDERYGTSVNVSDESDELLDTGGGLIKARRFLEGEEPILVHNADIFSNFPIEEMMAFHAESEADATLLVSARESSRALLFDSGGLMKGWRNKLTGQVRPADLDMSSLVPLAFGGVHIIEPKLIEKMEQLYGRRPFSITDFYVATCLTSAYEAFIPKSDYVWVDIGRHDTLARAREIAETTQF